MKKAYTLLGIIFVAVILGETAWAEMYKWVDENGVTQFSDSPPKKAAPSGKIETRPLPEYKPPEVSAAPSKPGKNIGKPKTPAAPSKQTQNQQRPRVELYLTSWCPWCKKAKEYFQAKGVSFVEYDIEKDEGAARRKNELDHQKGVPFAVVNGKFIHGYAPSSYEEALLVTP